MKLLKALPFVLSFMIISIFAANASMSTVKKSSENVNVVALQKTAIEKSDLKIFTKNPLDISRGEKVFKKDVDTMFILKLILCWFLPPLAVFLEDGIGMSFWINLLLTLLLFWIPGVVHAFLVILGII